MFQIYEEYNIKINTDIIIRDCYNKDASYILFIYWTKVIKVYIMIILIRKNIQRIVY